MEETPHLFDTIYDAIVRYIELIVGGLALYFLWDKMKRFASLGYWVVWGLILIQGRIHMTYIEDRLTSVIATLIAIAIMIVSRNIKEEDSGGSQPPSNA